MEAARKVNYQKELERLLGRPQTKGKTLLLHSCCAPCSSYVLEYLRMYFNITALYYNPNITQAEEYEKRVREQKRLILELNGQGEGYPIAVLEGEYEPERYFQAVRGLEERPEGGERCEVCYELRLRRTAELAKSGKYDYFTTTLTISPLKDARKLNEIGRRLSEEYGVPYLFSDFKKKEGYKRSVELSARYGLYRQDYCGCVFSRRDREKERK